MQHETVLDEIRIQRERYAKIAAEYESVHQDPEHVIALRFLEGMLHYLEADSVLDVGAGNGRCLRALKKSVPGLRAVGVEPVAELRTAGYERGTPPSDLQDGDAYALQFADGEFDVVCEFGMLHHVREPNRAVAEMLRVAKKAIFISDQNNFGGGSAVSRLAKQGVRALGLWPLANYLKTGGKGYSITEGDGLFYSYSVFDSLPLIKQACGAIHLMNALPAGDNFFRSCRQVALLGIKRGVKSSTKI